MMRSNTINLILEGLDKKDLRDLKSVSKKFFSGNADSYKSGNWRIGVGGYDLQYEVYYKEVPVFGCIDNEISVYQSDYREYAKELAKISGDKVVESVENPLNEASILKNSSFSKYFSLDVTSKTSDFEVGFMEDKDNPKDKYVFIYSKKSDSCIATFSKSDSNKILKGIQDAMSKF